MKFINYLPIILLTFFSLKILISYIAKSTESLKEKSIKKQIENGILSIKDIQKNNYTEFIKVINIYFEILGVKNPFLFDNGNSDLTNFKGFINNDPIFISCVQNDLLGKTPETEDYWSKTNKFEIEKFLSRILINDCKKGIFITNSTFSSSAIEFVNEFNSKNLGIEIKLIDGYELIKSIRNHKYYILKEGLINENKYTV